MVYFLSPAGNWCVYFMTWMWVLVWPYLLYFLHLSPIKRDKNYSNIRRNYVRKRKYYMVNIFLTTHGWTSLSHADIYKLIMITYFRILYMKNTITSSSSSAAYRHQSIGSALVWIKACRLFCAIHTNAGLLSIGPLGTHFNENLIKLQNFSFRKMHLKISPAKWRPCCPGGNKLTWLTWEMIYVCVKKPLPQS